MSLVRPVRLAALAGAALTLATALPPPPARAAAEDTAPPQPATFEHSDRKKIMSVRLPANWKAQAADAVPEALASFQGWFGEPEKSPNGTLAFYVDNRFSRATLAHAMDQRPAGKIQENSVRQGPGFLESCALDPRHIARWARFIEKGGRIYVARLFAHASVYEQIRPAVQAILDTVAVPGEAPPPSPGQGFAAKKVGEFDVVTDSEDKSVLEVATDHLSRARATMADLLKQVPRDKPLDASRPVAWLYQNGLKYEERAKSVFGEPPEHAGFDPVDRAAIVKLMGHSVQGFDQGCYFAGGGQYLSQYFGGEVPIWVGKGLATYAMLAALSGGKIAKIEPQFVQKAQQAVAVSKRPFDQWLDLTNWGEVTDNDQGMNELFALHYFFRNAGKGRKYRKAYEGYLATLRQTGDPVLARKSWDGTDFAELGRDFKAWAPDWK